MSDLHVLLFAQARARSARPGTNPPGTSRSTWAVNCDISCGPEWCGEGATPFSEGVAHTSSVQSSIMQLRSMQQRTRRAAQVRTTALRGEGAELVGNVGLLIMHVSTFA